MEHHVNLRKRKQKPYDQILCESLALLEHYHIHHTHDKITRFRNRVTNEEEPDTVIYIVSDPEWIQKLEAFTASEFNGKRGEELGTPDHRSGPARAAEAPSS